MLDSGNYVGRPIRRVEDDRLLSGRGRYTSDLLLERMAQMVVVRSDHPAANIRAIDVSHAKTMPGVLGAWTGADLAMDSLGGIRWEERPPMSNSRSPLPPIGDPSVAPWQPVLAVERVRYQGEPLAIIVAESINQARDAADAVLIDYTSLDAVMTAKAAIGTDSLKVWDQLPDNLCFAFSLGDAARTAAAFKAASHVTSMSMEVPRLVASAIEPRNYVGVWDAGKEQYLLYAAAGKPQLVAKALAIDIFGVARDKVRVVTEDVGGGFGSKNVLYPEEVLVLWAARKLGRPIRWVASRSETFLSDVQGRDQSADLSLALDPNGIIVGLRAQVLSNLGAYLGPKGTIPPVLLSRVLCSVYRVPTLDLQLRAVYTNTPPTGPYRGAGAPEAVFMIERLIDTAAREMGMSPAEMRRKNLIPPDQLPYSTAAGLVYDSGDFAAAMAAAEQDADIQGFSARRDDSQRRGKVRGIGYGNMVEWGVSVIEEKAKVSCAVDGIVTVYIGTMSNGQSHETVYAQLTADLLGVEIDRIKIRQGDSAETPEGLGTGASRSMTISGTALVLAARRVIDSGRGIAAEMLEASAKDLVFSRGFYEITGTDRKVSLQRVVEHAASTGRIPGNALEAEEYYLSKDATYPNGCHIAEVEVDPETGVVSVLRYSIAQDVGRALNPMVVEGQLIGGVMQGLGEALLEQVICDGESGQLLSGSFMDYALPRADTTPSFRVRLLEVPSRNVATGVKPCGEIGATGGPATIVNAIIDALGPYGVKDIPMPVTPERVVRAIAWAREHQSKSSSRAVRSSGNWAINA